MKTLRLVCLSLLIAAIFAGCKDNKKPDDEVVPGKLLTEVYSKWGNDSERLSIKLYYDNQDRIIKQELYHETKAEVEYEYTFTYNNEGVTGMTFREKNTAGNWVTQNCTVSKEGNSLKLKDGNTVVGTVENLNTKGCPASTSNDMYTDEYEYDAKGNITRMSRSGSQWYQTYTYDDKKSPFHDSRTPKWMYVAGLVSNSHIGFVNNPISETETYTVPDENDEDVTHHVTDTYEYTFDSDGFPVTQTMKNSSGTAVSVTRFVYSK